MITSRRRRATLVALVSAALALPLAAPAQAAPVTQAPGSAAVATATSGVAQAPLATATKRSSMKISGYESLASTHKKTYIRVRVANGTGQRLALQRHTKGKWRTVATTRAPRAAGASTVRIRVPKKAGRYAYRVVMSKSSANKRIISKKVRVFQSDYAKHKRYISKARGYMKRWCPSTPILIDSPGVSKGGPSDPVGLARWEWSYRGSKATWKQSIELRSGLSNASLRHVAIHECAHVVQLRPIAKSYTTYQKTQARAERVFRKGSAPALEQQADCMAYAITRDKSQMYYTKSCSSSRLKNAKGMWKSYGRKYQSPTHSWTWRN